MSKHTNTQARNHFLAGVQWIMTKETLILSACQPNQVLTLGL